jgi:hypothetical protein
VTYILDSKLIKQCVVVHVTATNAWKPFSFVPSHGGLKQSHLYVIHSKHSLYNGLIITQHLNPTTMQCNLVRPVLSIM